MAMIPRTSARCEHLFVYGSLRSGMQNDLAVQLRSEAVMVGPARVKGKLYLIVNCARVVANNTVLKRREFLGVRRYPGLIPSHNNDDWVVGEVYHLPNTQLLEVLDAYEGCGPQDKPPFEFSRVVYPALLDTGKELEVFLYLYLGDTSSQLPILGGDYAEYLKITQGQEG